MPEASTVGDFIFGGVIVGIVSLFFLGSVYGAVESAFRKRSIGVHRDQKYGTFWEFITYHAGWGIPFFILAFIASVFVLVTMGILMWSVIGWYALPALALTVFGGYATISWLAYRSAAIEQMRKEIRNENT